MTYAMRRFILERKTDLSGVSGTGVVAEGLEFTDGTCCLHWLSKLHSHSIFPSIKVIRLIHGHEGATEIKFID